MGHEKSFQLKNVQPLIAWNKRIPHAQGHLSWRAHLSVLHFDSMGTPHSFPWDTNRNVSSWYTIGTWIIRLCVRVGNTAARARSQRHLPTSSRDVDVKKKLSRDLCWPTGGTARHCCSVCSHDYYLRINAIK